MFSLAIFMLDNSKRKIQVKCDISSGSVLFTKIKTINRNRNTSFYRNADRHPLRYMKKPTLTVLICMVKSNRMNLVNVIFYYN